MTNLKAAPDNMSSPAPISEIGGEVQTMTPQVVVNVPGPPEQGFNWAETLNAAASLLWPLVVALALILYREQIASLISRIRKGSMFGAEAEFDGDLENLRQKVIEANEEIPAEPISETVDEPSTEPQMEDPVREEVMAETLRSPRLGLMLISAEIDKLARRIAASTGHQEKSSVREQIRLWSKYMPPASGAAYRLFADVRNHIVHGKAASEQEILSAIDSGLKLYTALASIPLEKNVVLHPGVDIFGDEQCTQPLMGKGLIIRTTTADGTESTRIFPTTQTHYFTGMNLTWQWNPAHHWGPAWYRDPETGEIKKAWSSSLEFVGQDLDRV